MKMTLFLYPDCTTDEADFLVAQYRRRGVVVVRSLNPDRRTWTVSAKLPESNTAPRPDRRWQNRMWG
ncbi:hypothetical protein OS580_004153 [Escherichia coli]|nr:hypothetical protein [Escherichia coli]